MGPLHVSGKGREAMVISSAPGEHRTVPDLLVETEPVSGEQLAAQGTETDRTNLSDSAGTLIGEGGISPQEQAMLTALQLNIPFVDLKRQRIQPQALGLIHLSLKPTITPCLTS